MKRLDISTSAQRDLRRIVEYLYDQTGDRRYGRAVAQALVTQCEKLAELSGTMGRPRPDIRENLRSTPFRNRVIYFEYRGDDMVIVAILSARQDSDAYFEATEGPDPN
jgi:plasmid stabilization system protein ParE